eukprot:scaffold2401_cov111-Cylindrotheca_fusiformis.AAC.5
MIDRGRFCALIIGVVQYQWKPSITKVKVTYTLPEENPLQDYIQSLYALQSKIPTSSTYLLVGTPTARFWTTNHPVFAASAIVALFTIGYISEYCLLNALARIHYHVLLRIVAYAINLLASDAYTVLHDRPETDLWHHVD